ncbi:MAG: GNAT family N-acetyltransferase [Chelatococcus sp.]|uniref:GNAT family N-acetyltransferase n=1 Tax=Chelatococcus sp. TaxID=1953771 RepID=UPI0025C3A77D|nr:GNAT family N-acetyltransferase [Chelatococcus sp.]MBX3539604.1 GNAT family N-acetyltransferase [Chelatococcus sp.]
MGSITASGAQGDGKPAIVVRPAVVPDVEGIATVHVQAWHETYTGLIPEAVLSALSISDRAARWRAILGRTQQDKTAAAFVAECGGQIVGFASGDPQRTSSLRELGFTGEIGAIYVLRAHQRAGIGHALMASVAGALRSQGHEGLSLWVLSSNLPARGFYESLGGRLVGEREEQRGDAILAEVAYGWRDLRPLLARA